MDGGDVISICEYAEFNHSFLAAGSASYDVVLAPAVAVPNCAFIGASVRVHARNLASGCTYQIVVQGANPSRRDAAEFVYKTADLGSTPATTGSANPSVTPGLIQLSAPITQCQHPYVKVVLRATPAPSGGVTLYVIISVDLVCRSSG